MTDYLININNLSKKYYYNNLEYLILKKIKLSIKERDILSITGPSGVGKTTLWNIIGMLDSYDSGEYYFNKNEIIIIVFIFII